MTMSNCLKALEMPEDISAAGGHGKSDPLDGFIYHPLSIPLSVRRRRPAWWHRQTRSEAPGELGIIFRSDTYLPTGSLIELSISLRGEMHRFSGEIVLVREIEDGYEIGLWLASHEDTCRARIVEQVCHIESYLRIRRLREGPFLSRETVAREWISNFAHQFPA